MKGFIRNSLVSAIIIASSAGIFLTAHAQLVGVTLPSVPGSVAASAGSAPEQINVSWSASTESSGSIEGYYVYRNGVQVANTAGTSVVDVTPGPGFYSYTVAAYDATGQTSQQSSPPVSVTLVSDTTPPTTPTSVTISGATTTNSYYAQVPLTISWSASTDNVGVVGYYIYRNGVSIVSSTSAFNGTSITDSVQPGTYTYTVIAYDAAQNQSRPSSPATITIVTDNAPPSVPTRVVVQQISANGVTVSWATSTDAVGVAGYQLFRNGTQIATTTAVTYTDSGLSTNAQYSYSVAAYDGAGNISTQSQPPANVTIQPFNGPGTPIIVDTSFVGTSSVQVSWTAGVDPIAIANYTLYRDSVTVATVTSTRYTDTGLAPGLHFYSVSETDISGATSPTSVTSTAVVPVVSAAAAAMNATSQTSVVAPTVVPTPAISTTPPAVVSSGITALTQSLYYGLQGTQVSALQSLLADGGYLNPAYATGFFGNLTLGAVEKFQCDKNIVCTGVAGYGIVGPKTRTALNALSSQTTVGSATTPSASTSASAGAGTSVSTSVSVSANTSTAAIMAEINTLESELASLEMQLPR